MVTMKIERPKKDARGTFEGQIWKSMSTKERYQIVMKNAKIISTKQNGDEWYIYIKCKEVIQDICDINDEVIDHVKKHCSSWFKSALSDDLIEDYFSNNLMYDKTHGQVVRLKCLNDLSEVENDECVTMSVVLKQIRFFKQKFVLEWDIDEIEGVDPCAIVDLDGDDESSSDEDIVPVEEEIENIKAYAMNILKERTDELVRELERVRGLENKIAAVERLEEAVAVQDEVENL